MSFCVLGLLGFHGNADGLHVLSYLNNQSQSPRKTARLISTNYTCCSKAKLERENKLVVERVWRHWND